MQWLLHLQRLSVPITNFFSARQPLLQACAPFCPLKPICPTEFYSEALHPGLNSHMLALSTSSKPAVEQVGLFQSGLKGSQFLRTALKEGLPLSQQPTAQPVSGREGAAFSDSPLERWLGACSYQRESPDHRDSKAARASFPLSCAVSKRVYCCSMSITGMSGASQTTGPCKPAVCDWAVYAGSV